MTKRARAFVLLGVLIALTACTSQQLFSNKIYLLNNCGQTLQIVVANDSNIGLPERTLTIAYGSQELIGLYDASREEDVVGQVQDSYSLRITADDGASLQVNGRTLREHLRQIEKLEKGSARQWIVANQSFCPSKGTAAP